MAWFLAVVCLAALPGMFIDPLWVASGLGVALLALLALVFVTSRSSALVLSRVNGSSERLLRSRAAINSETESRVSDLHKGLMQWVGLALVFRLGVALIVNGTTLWLSFGPDAYGWEGLGRRTYLYWVGQAEFPSWFAQPNSQTFYATLNGLSWAVFGSARFPLSFLNAVMGVLCAWLLGLLAMRMFDLAVGRRAFLLALFFPSLVLWHGMNLREVWAHIAILLFVLAAVNARRKLSPTSIGVLLGSLVVLVMIRTYMVPIVFLAFVVSVLATRPSQLPYALVALLAVSLFVARFGSEIGIDLNVYSTDRLESIQRLREGLAYGGSAYGEDVDTSTVSGALTYLPEGMARFLFSPFPWAIQSWQQALAAPESMMWFVIFCQGAWFIARSRLHDVLQWTIPIVLMVVLTAAYGLASGNEGTAFRHRAQVMVLMFAFSAAGQTHARRKRSVKFSDRGRIGAPVPIRASG